MCLDTKRVKLEGAPLTKKILEAIHVKKARKDIVVWKKLRKITKHYLSSKIAYLSLYKNFEYKRNVLYTAKLDIKKCGNSLEVNEGLHAYIKKPLNSSYNKNIFLLYDEISVKMIIPKGSLYIKGDNKDIVSNQLIWKTK